MIIPIHLHAKGQESNIKFDYSLLLQPRLAYESHTCRALIPGMIFKKEREHFYVTNIVGIRDTRDYAYLRPDGYINHVKYMFNLAAVKGLM